MKIMRKPTLFEVLLTGLIICLCVYNGSTYLQTLNQRQEKERDAQRISDIAQIQAALAQYYTDNGNTYPACLHSTGTCKALEGSPEMAAVPKDPSGSAYSYASFLVGGVCGGFHLGTSLERTGSQALLTGTDAPPEPASKLCPGSAADFSGLSYAKGGAQCDTSVGTAQPTTNSDGETCYDIARHRPN